MGLNLPHDRVVSSAATGKLLPERLFIYTITYALL